MATIRELIIKITSKGGSRAATDLAKAKKEAKELGKEAEKSENKVKEQLAAITKYARMSQKSFKTLANGSKMVAMGLSMAIGAQGLLLAQTAMYGEEVKRFAQGFGASISQAQEYREAFKVLGGTTDDLADALGTVVDRGKDALEGSKTYQKEFRRLGITMTELRGAMKKGAIDLFDLYVKKSVKVKDKTEAITAAVRLFGDDLGRRLLPVLTSGEEAFDKIIKMSKMFGLTLSKGEIDNLAKLRTEFRQFEFFVLGMARRLSAKLTQAILPISDDLQAWIFRIEKIINSRFDGWTKMMGEEIEKLAQYIKEMYDAMGGDKALNGFLDALTELTPLLITLGAGFAAVLASGAVVTLFTKLTAAAAFLYTTVGLLIAIVADLVGYFNGVDSVLGDLVNRFPDARRAVESVAASIKDLKWVLGGTVDVLKHMFKTLNEEGVDGATGVERVLVEMVKAVATIVKGLALVIGLFAAVTSGAAAFLDIFTQISRKIDEIIDKMTGAFGSVGAKFIDRFMGEGTAKRALSAGVDVVEGASDLPVVGKAAQIGQTLSSGLWPMRALYRSAKRHNDASKRADALAASARSNAVSTNAAANMAARMDPFLNPQGLTVGDMTLPPSARMPGTTPTYGMQPVINVTVQGSTDKQNAVEVGRKVGQGTAGALRQAKAANDGGAK